MDVAILCSCMVENTNHDSLGQVWQAKFCLQVIRLFYLGSFRFCPTLWMTARNGWNNLDRLYNQKEKNNLYLCIHSGCRMFYKMEACLNIVNQIVSKFISIAHLF